MIRRNQLFPLGFWQEVGGNNSRLLAPMMSPLCLFHNKCYWLTQCMDLGNSHYYSQAPLSCQISYLLSLSWPQPLWRERGEMTRGINWHGKSGSLKFMSFDYFYFLEKKNVNLPCHNIKRIHFTIYTVDLKNYPISSPTTFSSDIEMIFWQKHWHVLTKPSGAQN